uniref:Beta-lactamase-related domain-containing protein n=1 Tax=Romanomermis culicivorax TaxID=13658 RepID=A0A915HRW0_ROMCU
MMRFFLYLSIFLQKTTMLLSTVGFGYSDVENLTPCTTETVMRIASISKPMTMTLAAKFMGQKILNLDDRVQNYVDYFPEKYFKGEKVDITTRHLVSHVSGIRGYAKADSQKSEKEIKQEHTICQKCKTKKKKKERGLDSDEYYLNREFKSVKDSLMLFQNDDLLCKPGDEFHYSSHAWTLISAVLEGCVEKSSGQKGVKFENLIRSMFKEFGLNETYLDENSPLITNRAKYYRRDKRGRLYNVPSVNNSYKWAGGGYLSNVEDLLKFSSILSQIFSRNLTILGLNRHILKEIWTPRVRTSSAQYAMGWFVERWPSSSTNNRDFLTTTVQTGDEKLDNFRTLDAGEFYVYHSGGAIGASSFLLIKPASADVDNSSVAVVILTNLHECGGLHKLATDLCALFLEW